MVLKWKKCIFHFFNFLSVQAIKNKNCPDEKLSEDESSETQNDLKDQENLETNNEILEESIIEIETINSFFNMDEYMYPNMINGKQSYTTTD